MIDAFIKGACYNSECYNISIVKVAKKARPSLPAYLCTGPRTVVQCMHIANMQIAMISMQLAIYFYSICMLLSEDGETYMSYFVVADLLKST